MNMLFRYALRLTAVSALSIIIVAPASASDIDQAKSFKLAMGPTSAAQKNQGPAKKFDTVEVKPPHRTKHRRRHHVG